MKEILLIGSIVTSFLVGRNVYADHFHHQQEGCTYENCPYYEKEVEEKNEDRETTYPSCGRRGCYHSYEYGCSGMHHSSRGHHYR